MSKKKTGFVPPKKWSAEKVEGFRQLLKSMDAFKGCTEEQVASDTFVQSFVEGALEVWNKLKLESH